MAHHYWKSNYWDDRYTKDTEPFDWYQRYAGIREILLKYAKKDASVLVAGCGNSRLSEDMIEDGFAQITNIDASSVVIDQMVQKYKDKSSLKFKQMNALSLNFADESFDLVIAKGLVDAILCCEGSTENAAKLCAEVSRVLRPGGVFFVVSFGDPEARMNYLQSDVVDWKITSLTVPKPTTANTNEIQEDGDPVHHIYVCQKGG